MIGCSYTAASACLWLQVSVMKLNCISECLGVLLAYIIIIIIHRIDKSATAAAAVGG